MFKQSRSQLALGVILILLGGWFLLDKSVPAFHSIFEKYTIFPFNMFLIGAVIFVIGLVIGQPGLSVPAVVVAGIGGLFYYFEEIGSYEDWYMWLLVLGFVGVGSILAGILGDNTARNIKRGLNAVVVSAVLFLVFSSIYGGWALLGNYAPAIILILLGLWVFGRGIYRSFRSKGD